MKLFYSPSYTLAAHAFDTTRKAKWVAASLQAQPIAHVELVAPTPLTKEQLCAVHDPRYVQAILTGKPRALAESAALRWDASLWEMVCASNGGMVDAALCALRDGVAGTLSSGLHHARYARGAGFCTFNGLVSAALAALAAGAQTILILDLDAHCGGGTMSLIAAHPAIWQVDLAVHEFDWYEPQARQHLKVIDEAETYLPMLQTCLHQLEHDAPRFDLCIYNAGMDPHKRCLYGGRQGVTTELLAERERVVFAWCRQRNIPIAFTLAGGYIGPQLTREELVGLHRLTIEEATK
jgi:acetoin utilization deacetylase AcuC-like enzyme